MFANCFKPNVSLPILPSTLPQTTTWLLVGLAMVVVLSEQVAARRLRTRPKQKQQPEEGAEQGATQIGSEDLGDKFSFSDPAAKNFNAAPESDRKVSFELVLSRDTHFIKTQCVPFPVIRSRTQRPEQSLYVRLRREGTQEAAHLHPGLRRRDRRIVRGQLQDHRDP